MATTDGDDLFAHFERELAYLRSEGAEFARTYPKIAGRLDLNAHESRDPHIERMLESFAFLTARIQRTIDADFPLIPAGILEAICPQMVAPVPSMAIARFDVDPDQARAALGFHLPGDVPLFAESRDGLTCRFRTRSAITLWPVEAAGLDMPAPERVKALGGGGDVPAVLRLRLKTQGRLAFGTDVRPESLRLLIDADLPTAGAVFELLMNRTARVLLTARDGGAALTLDPECLRPVGFGPEEAVLSFPPHIPEGYRLLREYFTFPRKFLFLDVDGLTQWPQGREADLLFVLDRLPERAPRLDRVTVRTNCAPVVNLFPKTSEPVRLDQTQTEYRLVPDSRWERATEIHSIVKVSTVSNAADDSRAVRPYFSYDHRSVAAGGEAYWIARRRPSLRGDIPGTDIWLALVDLGLDPAVPPSRTVFAHTLCTNRGVAEQLPPGALFHMEVDAPVRSVTCLSRPTIQIPAPSQGEALWRLVSTLALNHLSLASRDGRGETLKALREILLLYAAGCGPEAQQQALGLHSLSTRPMVRKTGDEAWRGFVRGTEVTLELDEEQFIGSSAFLLAGVLDRFLALHAGINGFTQLVLKSRQRDGVWKRWPARVGERDVL